MKNKKSKLLKRVFNVISVPLMIIYLIGIIYLFFIYDYSSHYLGSREMAFIGLSINMIPAILVSIIFNFTNDKR